MVWHVVWTEEEGDGFAVHCIPHGRIGTRDSHYAALLCGYEHDFDIRRDLTMPGYSAEDLKEAGW